MPGQTPQPRRDGRKRQGLRLLSLPGSLLVLAVAAAMLFVSGTVGSGVAPADAQTPRPNPFYITKDLWCYDNEPRRHLSIRS